MIFVQDILKIRFGLALFLEMAECCQLKSAE